MNINLYQKFHQHSQAGGKIINKNNFTYFQITNTLNKIYKNKGKLKILDYGCGVGAIDLYLANFGNLIVGTDISTKAIEVAKENASKNNLSSMVKYYDLKEWEKTKKAGEFDLVLCFEVLEHVPNEIKVLRDINLVLKRGGYLILSSPSLNAPLFRLGLTNEFDKEVGHLRRYNLASLSNVVSMANFKIIDTLKTEGVLRNSLFIFKPFGSLIRFIRGPLVGPFHFLDRISVRLFGESDLIIIAQKP